MIFKNSLFSADDEYPLAGRLYKAEQAKGIITVASATVVLHDFIVNLLSKRWQINLM